MNMRYWAHPISEVMDQLKTSSCGLSQLEADERLKRIGPNAVQKPETMKALYLFFAQLSSPLVIILILGAFIALLTQEWIEACIIFSIVFGSAILGFLQEYSTSQALEALHEQLSLHAIVLRDKKEISLSVDQIVPGDIVLLSAGCLVPADGLLIQAQDFLVSEASLTGESFPVEKQVDILCPDASLRERTNSVFYGTSVRSGFAKMLVAQTGKDTVLGSLSTKLTTPARENEFTRGMRQLGYMLIRAILLMAVLALISNHLLGRSFIESLLFSVALTVGLSPELLPAITSITLAAGARSMEKKGVLVRRLEAIENIGSIDTLCCDKTGTLTQGALTLVSAEDIQGTPCEKTKQLAFLNALFETGIKNVIDESLVELAQKEYFSTEKYRKIDEVPYDFQRKRLMVVVESKDNPQEHLLVVKGSFETVLNTCTTAFLAEKKVVLDSKIRSQLESYYTQKSEQGLKVLAIATSVVSPQKKYDRDDEHEMTFLGFLVFEDPLKPDAAQSIQSLRSLGINIKVVTGDNRYAAAYLARQINLNSPSILTGKDIDEMSEEAFFQRAENIDLFVEVTPEQKEKVVHALQQRGHAVGYMGDGINDAPALCAADVGISVYQAVDVARESADVVLLSQNLHVLQKAVEEGRHTFINTLKYLNITMSANFGNLLSVLIITPFLPFLAMSAGQILLNNFLSDLPLMMLSTDRVDKHSMDNPTRWHISHITRFMVAFGVTSTLFDLLTCFILRHFLHADKATFQTSWFLFSLVTELIVVFALRTRQFAFESKPSSGLVVASCLVAFFSFTIPFSPVLASIFGFTSLSWPTLATLSLLALGYFFTTELIKRFFFQKPILLKKGLSLRKNFA